MNKRDIVSFFDKCACGWDSEQIRNEKVIDAILDNGGIRAGINVLDVACGTGVLFPDYIKRNASVTAIDISAEMVKIAKSKFSEVEVICGDAENYVFDREFDAVMIYNAFPHFPNPKKLIESLANALHKGGRISVAHGMSKEALEQCHSGKASKISLPLPETEKLAEIMEPYFYVDIMISDSQMYQVSGVKK